MSAYRLRRFSKPGILKEIEPQHLIEFLRPYREFLHELGIVFPETYETLRLYYDGLAHIFMSPDNRTPQSLIDALYLIDEMATDVGMDALLEETQRRGLTLPLTDESTPAEVALLCFLADPETLERAHARQQIHRTISFEYYQADNGGVQFEPPNEDRVGSLERDLDRWFASMRRGRGTRVFMFDDGREVWFLVRHGLPFRREESLDGDEVTSVCFRPLSYDTVVFDRRFSELKVSAKLIGERRLYCEQFGQHLFGNRFCFPGRRKYTLDPLRDDGPGALACGDIEGVQQVTLTEVRLDWGGAYREAEVRRADDLFAALSTRGEWLPESARITAAVFKVQFVDSDKPRRVRIKPANVARYTRDSDAAPVEKWLERRGFILKEEAGHNAPVGEILAGR